MQADNRRRTLKELQALYALKPHIRDVLVEGPSDARFYAWFLREKGAEANVRVYEVEHRVNVPNGDVLACHPELNRRGRLVAIAKAAEGWGVAGRGVIPIADADFAVLEPGGTPESLLLTDFPAVETYALQERPLAKFMAQFTSADSGSTSVLDVLLPVWLHIYVARYVLHRHSSGNALVKNFAKKCFDKAGEPSVDIAVLIRDSAHGGAGEVARLTELADEILARAPGPSLKTVRGHDVAPILIEYLGLKNTLANVDHVENLLRACIELTDIEMQPLFVELSLRVLD